MIKESKDINYEIVKHIGIVSVSKSKWTRELNLVSWNGKPAKYDLRDWSPEHVRMGKGISVTREEAEKVLDYLRRELECGGKAQS